MSVTSFSQFTCIYIYLWHYSPLLGLGCFISFLNYYTVVRTPWTGDQPIARPLPTHITTQTQNKCTQTFMPRAGFEPTIAVFDRVKTVHALVCVATVIGIHLYTKPKTSNSRSLKFLFLSCRCMILEVHYV
jgi:hypothetical protein